MAPPASPTASPGAGYETLIALLNACSENLTTLHDNSKAVVPLLATYFHQSNRVEALPERIGNAKVQFDNWMLDVEAEAGGLRVLIFPPKEDDVDEEDAVVNALSLQITKSCEGIIKMCEGFQECLDVLQLAGFTRPVGANPGQENLVAQQELQMENQHLATLEAALKNIEELFAVLERWVGPLAAFRAMVGFGQ